MAVAPSHTGSRASLHRPSKQTAWARRDSSAACSISSACSWFRAIGFSPSTCLPAARAASVCSWCSTVGVQIDTRSRSSRRTNSRQSVDVSAMPSRSAARATRSGVREQIATSSYSGTTWNAGAWTSAPHPTPMIPTLIRSVIRTPEVAECCMPTAGPLTFRADRPDSESVCKDN